MKVKGGVACLPSTPVLQYSNTPTLQHSSHSALKTLLITSVFPPETGGSGRWFWEIYRRLPRDRVVVAAGEQAGAGQFDRQHNLNIHRVPLRMSDWGQFSLAGFQGYRRAIRSLRRIVREESIERVHCGALLPDGWLGWLLQRRFGLPYVLYMHGEEPHYVCSSRQLSWMARRVIKGAEMIVANSQNTRRVLADVWQVPEDRVRVLHPGVDCQRFQPAERDATVRSKFGWDERPVILTVGRLQERKGHDMLIRALPAIRRAVPDVLYAIAGDGDRRQALLELTRSLDLQGHVRFRGEVDDDELIQMYQQCDLFVLPNRAIGTDIEGFGMVLLEAQACGKPVVAGASGGTAETMRVPDTGCLVPCDRPEELAQLLTELLKDSGLSDRRGKAGREWTVARFSWEALTRQASELLGMAG
jgi:phosphatidyl-myo-inositol dimannoside synthase